MPRGRPRTFDEGEVLDRALSLFVEHGYGGVSVADVVRETGVAAQSLYNTFGDKAALYAAAVERFGQLANDPIIAALESSDDPLGSLAGFVRGWKRHIGADPAGCCLFTRSLASGGQGPGGCDAEIARAYTERLRKALRGKARAAAGELPEGSEPDAVADAILTMAFGVAVVARGGLPGVVIERAVKEGLRLLGLSSMFSRSVAVVRSAPFEQDAR